MKSHFLLKQKINVLTEEVAILKVEPAPSGQVMSSNNILTIRNP